MPSTKEPRIRINCTIRGKPAEVLLNLKSRGLATSNRNAITQALMVYHQKMVEQDLAEARLRNLRELAEEEK